MILDSRKEFKEHIGRYYPEEIEYMYNTICNLEYDEDPPYDLLKDYFLTYIDRLQNKGISSSRFKRDLSQY